MKRIRTKELKKCVSISSSIFLKTQLISNSFRTELSEVVFSETYDCFKHNMNFKFNLNFDLIFTKISCVCLLD